MARKRMTATMLAEGMGASQNYLSKRLRDELPFTLNDLERMSAPLGTDTYSLILAAARSTGKEG